MGPGDSGLAAPTRANASAPVKLTEKEAKEIEEYEKIVRFRDTILAANHPTIKLPPGLNYARAPSEPGEVDTRPESLLQLAESLRGQNPSLLRPVADAGVTTTHSQQPKPFATGATEINPIFLEKSDELIRAEFQLRRQRIERSLGDEFEQRRVSKQVQAEPIESDLSDVLAKALTLVQATTIPFSANGGSIANHEGASDSFDDNTFYSSKHDTPESNLTSRLRRSSDDAMAMDGSRPSQLSRPESTDYGNNLATAANTTTSYHAAGPFPQPSPQVYAPMANVIASRPEMVRVPGLHILANSGNPRVTPGPARTEPDRVFQTASQGSENDDSQYNPNQPLLPRPHVIRNHDLIPVAPQPAKITPLTVVDVQTPVVDSALASPLGTSAQVAVLKNAPPVVACSDSSSQGARDTERRLAKNKRKADRQAPEAEIGLRVKAEPRSQSPLTAPAYTRPDKRRRQSQGFANESGQPEARYTQPPPNASYERPSQMFRSEQAPVSYQGPNPAPYLSQPAPSSSVRGEPAGEPNRKGDFPSDRHLSGDSYARPPPSGESYVRHPQPQPRDVVSYQHPPPREMHGPAAVPQVIAYDSYREPIRIYREPLEGPRASVRPEGESFIIPPRPPTRVMVDSYGREFVEPVIPSGRQSVAPLPRSGEPEVIYERLSSRLSSSTLETGPYNEGNVVYARPMSVYDPPVRRVYVSEPEYPYDHRDGQYREHQLQQRGYIQIVRAHDGRIIEERPADYVSRQAGYRPSRFEPIPPYIRMHSSHPDAAGREYNGSVHMDGRQPEGPQPYAREYAGSPIQRASTVHREYSMRPPERYREHQREATRGPDEITFIERPRGVSREIVYLDDVRQEAYR